MCWTLHCYLCKSAATGETLHYQHKDSGTSSRYTLNTMTSAQTALWIAGHLAGNSRLRLGCLEQGTCHCPFKYTISLSIMMGLFRTTSLTSSFLFPLDGPTCISICHSH